MNTIATPSSELARIPFPSQATRGAGEGSGSARRLSRLARILPIVAVLMPLMMVAGAAWLTWRGVA